ncbi:trypsin-like serine peptidase [Solimonas marina]|uniref:Trypsin-like peptidase domain-containing protein n=1 Tax=Solimonas marina TaxID=2714601 RepID=A0A969WA87_9GAMM|nr:trypsin-like peptidase domain-containing protein [Solimonas marina]NKF21781.1 hypothetical protein [Solimonas marina]
MRRLLLLLLALSPSAWAYTPDVSDLGNVALVQLDAKIVKSAVAAAKSDPLQFAVGVGMNATADSGSWDEPETGTARWRLRVASSGADSMSFAIKNLQLPADAKLYLYSDGGADVQGPYTAADNGTFWTPIVRSDDAVLEARMPSGEKSDFALDVTTAYHAYRPFSSKSFSSTNGTSGACEIDVACSAGDDWRDDIRAVVLLQIAETGGSYLCSGTLVNNAEQDDRPLILTAHHCDVTASTVTSTYAYFNVERSGCGTGSYGSVSENIRGSALVAGTSGTTVTDYTLFQLASTPPSSYNVYYAGWDASGTAPTSGVTIHHPAGDDKKISTYSTPATAQNNVDFGDFTSNTWQVYWAQGTTEEGSSGSGLLNQSHRVVGTLSGGSGACAAIGTANNGQADYYARLDAAWTAASSTGTTLQTALAADSGCTTVDGKDPGSADPVDCTGSTTGGSSSSDSGGGGGSLGLGVLPLLLIGLARRFTSRRACRA